MDIAKSLPQLFQLAADYQFAAFDQLLLELEASFSGPQLAEAYLLRAQLKLYTSDPTLMADLDKFAAGGLEPYFPFLGRLWKPDAPNRFIVFSTAPGQLARFQQLLPDVRERLAGWFGEQAETTVRQIQAEICYFTGRFEAALALAQEQPTAQLAYSTDVLLCLALQYRCYLALGRQREAEQAILEVIRLARAFPECVESYQCFRDWVNLTTSWNGDTPRFYIDKSGVKQPVLEDRLKSIREGSSQTRKLELPFVAYAARHCDAAYPLRQIYMDVFHALYWQSVGDDKQADAYLHRLYQMEQASGVITPLVECGEQLLPLLQAALARRWDCPPGWLERAMAQARQYEAGINRYVT